MRNLYKQPSANRKVVEILTLSIPAKEEHPIDQPGSLLVTLLTENKHAS